MSTNHPTDTNHLDRCSEIPLYIACIKRKGTFGQLRSVVSHQPVQANLKRHFMFYVSFSVKSKSTYTQSNGVVKCRLGSAFADCAD